MNRFQIGMYGSFDRAKYIRDFRGRVAGVEACLFEKEEDVRTLFEEAEARPFQVGIHFPLRAGRATMRDALFLSRNEEERRQALAWIEEELVYLHSFKPAYVSIIRSLLFLAMMWI